MWLLNTQCSQFLNQIWNTKVQPTIGISMSANCPLPLADLVLRIYEVDFRQWLLKNKDWKLALTFHSNMMLYLWKIPDSVIIYITSIQMTLNLRIPLILKSLLLTLTFILETDNGERLKIKLYDKRDDFTFPMVNFPSSNISASPACGVYT